MSAKRCPGDWKRARVNIDAHLAEVRLPPRVRALYEAIGDPSREHVFNHWRLMALDFVREQVRHLKREHGQEEVVDFAASYAGMGHAVVCGYAPRLGKVFYRADGGSNGYERELNYKRLVSYRPHDPATFFDEAHWFDAVASQITQEAYEPFNLPLTHLDSTN